MKTIYVKDPSNKKMNVTREFEAPLEQIWKAWTEKEILDQWWAPKPWKAETKSMDFREGGFWLYAMSGPTGEKHWSRADYKKIVPQNYFIIVQAFCDENGKGNPDMPCMEWKVEFSKTNTGTKVQVEITSPSEKEMKTIIEMGFEQGFSMGHDNLDQLLKK